MVQHSLFVAAGYACVTGAICVFEAWRIRRSGADVVTVFMVIFLLQCCAPGILIYACLPFVDPMQPTGVLAFDRIYAAADLQAALLVLSLTASFAFCFYTVAAACEALLHRVAFRIPQRSCLVVTGSPGPLLWLLAGGFVLAVTSFYLGGATMVERYTNLILLRSYSEQVKPTLLNGIVATSIDGWAWLSVAALFVMIERRGYRIGAFACAVFMATFMVLAVSRRDLFIPLLLAYLTLLLFDNRWRPRVLLAAAIPVLIWIAYGKELFTEIAAGGSVSVLGERYDTLASMLLRTGTDLGVTTVESVGTISLIDLPPRLGIDHLLAVLPRIYISSLHMGLDLPPRIVRLSTQTFASAADQDIPPGLFGQMWLDFRIFGPLVWACVLGLQVSLVQRLLALTVRTREACAAFAVIIFVIARPLNTGSYDFMFSLNVLVLLLGLLLTFRLQAVYPELLTLVSRPASSR